MGKKAFVAFDWNGYKDNFNVNTENMHGALRVSTIYSTYFNLYLFFCNNGPKQCHFKHIGQTNLVLDGFFCIILSLNFEIGQHKLLKCSPYVALFPPIQCPLILCVCVCVVTGSSFIFNSLKLRLFYAQYGMALLLHH